MYKVFGALFVGATGLFFFTVTYADQSALVGDYWDGVFNSTYQERLLPNCHIRQDYNQFTKTYTPNEICMPRVARSQMSPMYFGTRMPPFQQKYNSNINYTNSLNHYLNRPGQAYYPAYTSPTHRSLSYDAYDEDIYSYGFDYKNIGNYDEYTDEYNLIEEYGYGIQPWSDYGYYQDYSRNTKDSVWAFENEELYSGMSDTYYRDFEDINSVYSWGNQELYNEEVRYSDTQNNSSLWGWGDEELYYGWDNVSDLGIDKEIDYSGYGSEELYPNWDTGYTWCDGNIDSAGYGSEDLWSEDFSYGYGSEELYDSYDAYSGGFGDESF